MRTSVHETDAPAAPCPGTPKAASGTAPATAFLVQRTKRDCLISFEVFPPRPTAAAEKVWDRIDKMAQARPDYFSVTHGHQQLPNANREVIQHLLHATRLPVMAQMQPARTVNRSGAKWLWHGGQHLTPVVLGSSPALTTVMATSNRLGEGAEKAEGRVFHRKFKELPALFTACPTRFWAKASSGEQSPQGPVDPWWSYINPMLTGGFGLGSACSPARGPPPRVRRGPSRNDADVCMK